MIGVGMLGCGHLGSAVVRALSSFPERSKWKLRAVAVRDVDKRRDCALPAGVLTQDAFSVVDHAAVDIVVDVSCGSEPARTVITRALKAGKPVVTSNKEVLGAHGPALRRLAAESGVPLLYEAAVAGAVPVIRGLSGLVAADEIFKIEGVLSATTTFMLSHVEETGGTFAEALAEACRWGFAEADAMRNMDGRDAADTLAVLAQHLFGEDLLSRNVRRLGIDTLNRYDVLRSRGHSWRLVATALKGECGVVEPVALPHDHPFARLQGVQTGLTITAERSGAVTFIGTGAGGDATASALIADLHLATDGLRKQRRFVPATRARDHMGSPLPKHEALATKIGPATGGFWR